MKFTLEGWKSGLYKERQAVDALATTVKSNAAAVLAIAAALAIPLVPALFSANGVYTQTAEWGEQWRNWATGSTAVAIEGAGLFLSLLAMKAYSAWKRQVSDAREVAATALAVLVYTVIVVALIAMSDAPVSLKAVVCLIPVLGIAFYVGLGFETELANRLDEAEAEKLRKREERRAGKRAAEQNRALSERATEQSRAEPSKQDRAFSYLAEHPEASERAVASAIGCSPSTAHSYVKKWRDK